MQISQESVPSIEDIYQRANAICTKRGEQFASIEDWLLAEQELKQERTSVVPGHPRPS